MSKYDALWEYIGRSGEKHFKLGFDRIREICGTDIDHSFLRYKKELEKYGYRVKKISMKEKTVDIDVIE